MQENIMLEDAVLRDKLEALCTAMLDNTRIRDYDKLVKSFMENEASRTKFDRVADLEDELHERQHDGEEIAESEIDKLETLQQEMLDDPECRSFLEVQDSIQEMMLTVEQYLAAALELGRIPTKDEVLERLDELFDEESA